VHAPVLVPALVLVREADARGEQPPGAIPLVPELATWRHGQWVRVLSSVP